MIVFQYVSGFSADRWRDDAEATAVQSLLSRLFFLIYFDFLRLFALGKGQTHLSEEQKKIMAVDADKDRLRSTLSLLRFGQGEISERIAFIKRVRVMANGEKHLAAQRKSVWP